MVPCRIEGPDWQELTETAAPDGAAGSSARGNDHDELRDTGRSDNAGETAGTVGDGESKPAAASRKRKPAVRSKAAK